MPDPLVVDVSFFAAYFIPDEDHTHVIRLINRLGDFTLHAPDFFLIELGSILSVSLRRGRITEDELDQSLRYVNRLPLTLHGSVSSASLARQIALSRRTGLSFYDALYLDLALQDTAQIATLDGRLRDAALNEGVTVYS